MLIDRVIYPITTLGPGNRLVIWTVGCEKRCFSCANPELWHMNQEKDVNLEEMVKAIRKTMDNNRIDGVTVTGGEPIEQISELNKALSLLSEMTDDILIYTGFSAEEAEKKSGKAEWETLKRYTSVLIDDAYRDELNDNKCVLRGSLNQNVIFFDETKKDRYLAYMEKGRMIQNVFCEGRMISVGIHGKER